MAGSATYGLQAVGAASPTKLDLSGVTLTIGGASSAQTTLASESGAYQGTPYKVVWTTEATTSAAVLALEAGEINVGTFGDLSLVYLEGNQSPPWTASTVPMKEVAFSEESPATKAKYPPFELVASKASGITSIADLRGKTISYLPGGDIQEFLIFTLRAAGLKISDVTGVPLSASLAAAALTTGKVDAAIVNYEYVPEVLAAGAHVVETSIDKGVNVPAAGVYYANAKDLANASFVAALQDFLARTVRYDAWVGKNQSTVASDYVKYLNEPASLAHASSEAAAVQFEPITPAVITGEQKAANILHDYGAFKYPVNVNINYDIYFNAAIEAALAQLS